MSGLCNGESKPLPVEVEAEGSSLLPKDQE